MELAKLDITAKGSTAPSTATTPSVPEFDPELPETKQANNLLLFIAYLCVFGTVHHDMVFGLLELLAQRLSEWDVEVLLLALQHSAFHLRGEDPERLKRLLSTIEENSKGSGDKAPVRVEVMLELIQDVRNKRLRQTQQQLLDRGTTVRKWLNRLAARYDQSGVDRRFRATLPEICNIERTGRWWLVGASWIGKRAAGAEVDGAGGELDDSSAAPAAARDSDGEGDEDGAAMAGDTMLEPNCDAALLELAKKQRMNTIVKRNVFVALMGAEDPEAAMDRVLKLGLRVRVG